MRDLNIIRYAAGIWSITDEKWAELMPVLIRHVKGERLSPEELQARMGDSQPATSSKRGAVAVIPIRGVIAHRAGTLEESSGGTSTERVSAMLRQALADDSIGAICLDCDTPGGTIPGISELAAEIFAARGTKKITAISNSMMCSAGYWIASQADEIVSIPSGLVGSIGVFTAHADLSKALEQEGVDITMISAGKYKVEGNPYEPLSAEGKAFIQARVDEAYAQFVKDVARGRRVSQTAVREGYGQGRALSAPDALKAGLIDSIGSMDETLSRLVGRKVNAAGMRAEDLDFAPIRAFIERELSSELRAANLITPETLAEAERQALADDEDDLRQRLERF